jgi:protein phosphatase
MFDDGRCLNVCGRGVIGRDPAVRGLDLHHVVTLGDEALEVSRTHLEFGLDEAGLWVCDRYSTNGSELSGDGWRIPLPPGSTVQVAPRSTINIGSHDIRVLATSGRSVIGPVAVEWGAATRTGTSRPHNEDDFCVTAPVFAIADGMGGHASGEVASRAVVDALSALRGRTVVSAAAIAGCVEDARARMAGARVAGKPAPGSTVSGVVITVDPAGVPSWMVVNLGDSRTYRMASGTLTQLTVDHTVARELLDRGLIGGEAARSHPMGHLLTRAAVADAAHEADIRHFRIQSGDRVLVCSDGVTGTVGAPAIAALLHSARTPLEAADAVINAVAEVTGADDATAVVVDAVNVAPAR